MRYLLAILLLILTTVSTGQKLDSTQLDSTQVSIISYFKDGNNELSKYIEKEIILDIKNESYFSSFDEFDLFFRNVISAYGIQNWEFYHLEKDSYFVSGKTVDYIIVFKFERYESNKIDSIFIGKKRNKIIKKITK